MSTGAHNVKTSDSTTQIWKVPPGRFLVNLCRLEEPFRSKIKGHSKAVVKDLGCIDFCLTENILITYITKNELMYSSYKNRLKVAFQNYKDSQYKLTIVIVYDTTGRTYLNELQVFCIENLNTTPVIPLAKESKILDFLIELSNPKQTLSLVKKPQQKFTDSDAAEDQIRLVSLIPTVSRDTAQFLLETFGHIRGISEQNKETLTIVVGEECANNIWDFFHTSLT